MKPILLSLPLPTAFLVISALLLAQPTLAQVTIRASHGLGGAEPNDYNSRPSISDDGRYIVFESAADNMVAGDVNGTVDIFLYDTETGDTSLISQTWLALPGNGYCSYPVISGDGQFVAFASDANDLIPGDTNGSKDIFVRSLRTGVTELVSVDSTGNQGNGWSNYPTLSADGRYVAFASYADNLIANDTNALEDVFLHDRNTGTTTRVSIGNAGEEGQDNSVLSSISADGRFIAFSSRANNFVPGDTGENDIFVRDVMLGTTEILSRDYLGGQTNGTSTEPAISADGRFVAFMSYASDLVPGDTNGSSDVFVHDRSISHTRRVSVDSFGAEGDFGSREPEMSGNGNYVAFYSSATTLSPGDVNNAWDIYVHDLLTLTTERVSVSTRGKVGNNYSWNPTINWDGSVIAFGARASNLIPNDNNNADDILVHARWNGLGSNSIWLTGPTTVAIGTPLELLWYTAPSSSSYWLAYSFNLNGSKIGGHNLDIGQPLTISDSGINSGSGYGDFTSAPIPPGAAGLTAHFEILSRDAYGTLYDSNAWTVTF